MSKCWHILSTAFLADADHFNLHFPSNNTSNFVVFAGNINPLETFTLCLWLQTSKKGTLTLFSYGSATYFQCSETGKCVLVTEGKEWYLWFLLYAINRALSWCLYSKANLEYFLAAWFSLEVVSRPSIKYLEFPALEDWWTTRPRNISLLTRK